MRLPLLPLPLVALCLAEASARALWSLTEDLYAFPKYRVSFLNGLPVLNETAQKWLETGLKGGELEFLDQPWQESSPHGTSKLKGIESGGKESSESPEDAVADFQPSHYQLQQLKLAGKNPYICMIPPPVESHTKPIEEPQIEANPAQSWSLLQPLSNSCIYHRQGWFTYAYCHNNQVRQFREMAHSHSHHAGYVPEEDLEWEAFTLGQAAAIPSEGRELTSAQQEALTSSVDIVKSGGHRYLVQKWGDGTTCDKTGKPRKIEVQFHCSQTMTDTILFVKETSTCNYIMVINTPRLCGEPGFKTRLEQRDEAFIRCREVLDSEEAIAAIDKTLPSSSYPFKRPTRQLIFDTPPPVSPVSEEETRAAIDKKKEDMIKAAVEAFLSGRQGRDDTEAVFVTGGDGEMLIDIEFIDAEDADEALDKLEDLLTGATGKLERLEEALRAAGYDTSNIADATKDRKRKKDERKPAQHEEL
ncbi:hypothetical protein M0805_006053 [Coniferiporia weirii]|nr:hypothetical protein M0805_006053 [Coniferiporia weirii]